MVLLIVRLHGNSVSPSSLPESVVEVLRVESSAITTELADYLTTRLSVGMTHIIIDGPTLSDAGHTVTIEVRSDASVGHIRRRVVPIKQTLATGLRQAGIQIPLHQHD